MNENDRTVTTEFGLVVGEIDVSASDRALRFVSLVSQFRHGYDMMRNLWCLDFHV